MLTAQAVEDFTLALPDSATLLFIYLSISVPVSISTYFSPYPRLPGYPTSHFFFDQLLLGTGIRQDGISWCHGQNDPVFLMVPYLGVA